MDNITLQKLLLYIVAKGSEGRYTLTRTRIMKLVYLIDEIYYENKHDTLTKLDWIFYHYGPYTRIIQDLLDDMVGTQLAEENFETSTGSGSSYIPLEHIDPDRISILPEISMYAGSVLSFWEDKELATILDYIYNESLPMKDVNRQESLNFENITIRQEQLEREKEIVRERTRQFYASPRIQKLLEHKRNDTSEYIFPQMERVGKVLHIEEETGA